MRKDPKEIAASIRQMIFEFIVGERDAKIF